ncbi:mitochondrial amino-acid acetyltransferase [Calocera viscosa TUFC12733]|uniref:Amino-acid acetyltransferase, mitochondrial n=1 Tax=Calocera viscosa (strain TUFC12733) TaxID=1330018 RepID=A0A167HGR3_CALVF|nr:mitochondrial amino-acid acetyltransferase [Calocera viscosa TUFC12733]
MLLSSRLGTLGGLQSSVRGATTRAARTLAWSESSIRGVCLSPYLSLFAANTRHQRSRGLRDLRHLDGDESDTRANDFILSILNAGPNARDSKSYLANFAPKPKRPPEATKAVKNVDLTLPPLPDHQVSHPVEPTHVVDESPLLSSLLDPVSQHTALVKIQGPFTDRQLDSIALGMVYLEKLGLVSVIVVENDEWERGEPDERLNAVDDAERVVVALEKQGARARPVLQSVVRLGPKKGEAQDAVDHDPLANAHTETEDIESLRSALRAGEIPVLAPLALDSQLRTVRVDSNLVISALAQGMVEAAALDSKKVFAPSSGPVSPNSVQDLTPLRLMVINREGGVPSYARNGLPHLLVNLESEYQHIHETFLPQWAHSHPTALQNLALANRCLMYMPPTSSAIMVSHRSSRSLIANLITNKPATSSSLPHALLSKAVTSHTPTLIRHGLPMTIIRDASQINYTKMTALLENSFGRALKQDEFYARIERDLDFAIISGDYQGGAIVTRERDPANPEAPPIAYLDKFAMLPSHQGDGTVDFLWVALRDESYGLGLLDSRNPNVGGLGGQGIGRDLVWRSRADNPVNKWYFERSTGHIRLGNWVLFWCDAEDRLARLERHRGVVGPSFVELEEEGRLEQWASVVDKIPSSWYPLTA